MEYIRFGNTGMKVSKICLGTMTYGGPSERWPWALSEEQSRPFYSKGIRTWHQFFSTRLMYISYGASEEIVGSALKRFRPA